MTDAVTVHASGSAEMAYVGEVPWHGLGQKLEAGAPIETWKVAAGMDWRILRSKVRYNTTRGGEANGSGFSTMDDKHVLFRSDNREGLSIVSDNYKVVQPGAVLEFFRDLTESAGFQLETAGTLFGGRKFWALASTGLSESIVDAKDKVQGFLLLASSCDGSMATEGRYTSVRVVCDNTLQMAREGNLKVRILHRSTFKADEVKKDMGIDLAQKTFAKTIQNMRNLASVPLLDHDALVQTAALFQPGAYEMAKGDLLKVLDQKPVRRINELVTEGTGSLGGDLDGVKGTQWGWLNAVTQYVDHEARARSVDNRLNSAWFGNGSSLKDRAYDMALASLI